VAPEPAYVLFSAQVRAVTRLSPSFVRITFTGDELDCFADNGDDQRIKLVLPGPSGQQLAPPDPSDGSEASGDWYAHWLSLPDEQRNPMRTYTVRQVRPSRRELDVDFVLHADGGPASRWAESAVAGDPVQLVGPNARHPGSTRACGWNPPPEESALLIVGDETALPAVASILEGLPSTARGLALIEVPGPDDRQQLSAPAGIRIEWVVRADASYGVRLSAAVRQVAGPLLSRKIEPTTALPTTVAPVPEAELDDAEDLWDVPEPSELPAAPALYAWLAGEAGCITDLRRHLVKDLGFDRRAVAFMGYWRQGVAG
jgi:iron complex transport system ATP-binding protein